jgi:hypothetical protein
LEARKQKIFLCQLGRRERRKEGRKGERKEIANIYQAGA